MAFTAARRALVCAGLLSSALLTAAAHASSPGRLGPPYEAGGVWFVPAADPTYDAEGLAAVYEGPGGRATASGERFDPQALAAAHATLPLSGAVEVTNLAIGKTLTLRLNDRGPYAPGRILSLTPAALRALGGRPGESLRVRVRWAGVGLPTQFAERAPRPPADGAVSLQVGAYADRGRADRVVQQLSTAGPARVDALERGGARLYRVTFGPVGGPQAAEARRTLERLGYTDARVISTP